MHRAFLAVLLVVGLATPAAAYIIGDEYAMPPAKYRHAYTGALKVNTLPLRDVQRICGNDPHVLSCAITTKVGNRIIECEVYYPHGLTGPLLIQVRIHEMAHCNGYPPDHSGSIMEKRAACCSPLDRKRGH